jgi:uncharacterized RDD family membrane protein YckC
MGVSADRESSLDLPRAGFWRRLGAAFVDGLVVGIVETVLRLLIGPEGVEIAFVSTIGYFTYFHGRTGRTPGNAALSIRVVDLRHGTGRPIGYGRAFGRWLVSIFSGLVLLIGYLWMIWDAEKQTWHDKAVGSVVVFEGSTL